MGDRDRRRVVRRERSSENELAQITMMSTIIWYLIATFGELPPRICPTKVPGNETSPMIAIEAMRGCVARMIAVRICCVEASLGDAPLQIM